MIGRLLTREGAEALLMNFERQIPKKAAAASIRRPAKKKKAPAARATWAR
jgi:hypothetical protein